MKHLILFLFSAALWAQVRMQGVEVDGSLLNPQPHLLKWNKSVSDGQPVIATIGDSTTQGFGSLPNGWPNIIRQKIANSGIFRDRSAAQTSWITWNGYGTDRGWTSTGTWTKFAGWGITSAGGTSLYNVQSNGAGGTVTITCTRCDTFRIHYLTNTDTAEGWTGAMDGGAGVVYGNTTSGSPAWAAVTVSAASVGPHTFVITAPSTGNAYLWGANTYIATLAQAAVVHNLGYSSTSASHWCTNNPAAQSLGWVPNIIPAPTLVSIALGTNDYNGVSPAVWETNMDACLAYLTANVPTASFLLVDMQRTSSATGAGGAPRDDYYAATRRLAAKYRTGYINIGDHFGPYADANAQGLQLDGLHPSAAGYRLIAEYITSQILPQVSAAGTVSPAYESVLVGQPTMMGTATVTLGAGAAATATIGASTWARDAGGLLHLVNTGTIGTANATVFTVTFSRSWATTPECVISPKDDTTANLTGTGSLRVKSVSSSALTISVGSTALPTGASYQIAYMCFTPRG